MGRKAKVTVQPNDVLQKRRDAVSQMNPQLLDKLGQIEDHIATGKSNTILYYYNLGKMVVDIKQHPESYVGADGTPGLKLLNQAISTDERTLRKCAAFVEEYSEEQLNELLALRNPENGYQLHWGHVSPLLTLDNNTQRAQMATEAVEKLWNPETLHDAIKRRQNRAPSHGRSHAVPATTEATLQQMLKHTKQWISKNSQVWSNLFDQLLELPASSITEELIEQLLELQGELFLMNTETSQHQLVIVRVLERLRAVLVASETTAEDIEETPEPSNSTTMAMRHINIEPDVVEPDVVEEPIVVTPSPAARRRRKS